MLLSKTFRRTEIALSVLPNDWGVTISRDPVSRQTHRNENDFPLDVYIELMRSISRSPGRSREDGSRKCGRRSSVKKKKVSNVIGNRYLSFLLNSVPPS